MRRFLAAVTASMALAPTAHASIFFMNFDDAENARCGSLLDFCSDGFASRQSGQLIGFSTFTTVDLTAVSMLGNEAIGEAGDIATVETGATQANTDSAAVPLPLSLPLMATGLAGLGLLMQRRLRH